MPLTILAVDFDWEYEYRDELDHTIHQLPYRTEQRLIWGDRTYRRYSSIETSFLDDAAAEVVRVFLAARNYFEESFLISDPRDNVRAGVSLLGDTDAVNKDFTLPTTGRFAGDYPVDSISDTVVYDDGVPVTVSSIDVDTRTFTLASAPADPSVMTADYPFYKRVRQADHMGERPISVGVWKLVLSLLEVPA